MTTQHDFDQVRANGYDVAGAGFGRGGVHVTTRPRFGWVRGDPQRRVRRERTPGRRLIGLAAWLLVLLSGGLLGVSYAAQYTYVLRERHQHVASLIEAGSLDAVMIILSLLALGLSMAGLASKTERCAILVVAAASAVMSYAAARPTDPRSVLAYVMPPLLLAFTVDRVVSVYRRHVLGETDSRSPWAVLGDILRRAARGAGLAVLYGLRIPLAPRSTFTGVRLAILNATPLPAAPERKAIDPPKPLRVCTATVTGGERDGLLCGAPLPCPVHPVRKSPPNPAGHPGRGGTKTARFLRLVTDKYGGTGQLAGVPLDRVGPICKELAPVVELDEGAARTALRGAILAANPSPETPAEGDDK